MSETAQLPDGRHAPVEFVGRVLDRIGDRLHLAPEHGPILPRVGDVFLMRPERARGRPWRRGGNAQAVDVDGPYRAPDGTTVMSVSFDAMPVAACPGDYIYRIGKPLTPSLDERITAIERLLGIVADDLEVAADAEQDGRLDEATRIRSRALERIREMVAHPVMTVRAGYVTQKIS